MPPKRGMGLPSTEVPAPQGVTGMHCSFANCKTAAVLIRCLGPDHDLAQMGSMIGHIMRAQAALGLGCA